MPRPALAMVFIVLAATAAIASAVRVAGAHEIRHVVVIMMENGSFDSYFGTFPGADGIPMQNGIPTGTIYTKA